MKRRDFLTFGLATTASYILPKLQADTRQNIWKTSDIDETLETLFGTSERVKKHVNLIVPDIADNGNKIPIEINCDITCKKIILLQDANPTSCVAIFNQNEFTLPNNFLTIRMKTSGTICAVAQAKDNTLYFDE